MVVSLATKVGLRPRTHYLPICRRSFVGLVCLGVVHLVLWLVVIGHLNCGFKVHYCVWESLAFGNINCLLDIYRSLVLCVVELSAET